MDQDKRPRIWDYGCTSVIEPSEFTSVKTASACRRTAPEILNPTEGVTSTNDFISLFTKESDVYAFGVTVFEVNTFIVVF